ncbi:hypothetical protein Tco_1177117, partial [Tanacetum coccineum]
MLTARKSVKSLPTHRLASRYLSNSSSSDQFTSDDSSRDSPSDPLLETSSDSHSKTSSDSSLRHSSSGYAILDTPCDSPTVTSERLSRKRCRDSNSVADLEISSKDGYEPYLPREVSLGLDVEDSYEPYTEPSIDSHIQADIDECISYADAIRARGMDDRDVVETVVEEESVREDVSDHVTTDGAVEVTFKTLRDLGHMIVGVDLEVTTRTKKISALEQDNTKL